MDVIHFPRVSLGDPTIRNKPLQAEYEALLIDLSAKENIVRKEYQKLYRDSFGRFRKESYHSGFKEGKEPITIYISDPTKGESYFMRSDNMTGKIIHSNRTFNEDQTTNQQLDVSIFKDFQPNQIIEQTENMTALYLGEKNIESLLCAGLKIIKNDESFFREEQEMWICLQLSEIIEEVLIHSSYKELYRLFDISLLNPQSVLFNPLKDYKMTDFVSSCNL